VDVRLYDVAGREVRRLMTDAMRGPGVHSTVWDGRDATGQAVPSGVYFARLRTNGSVVTLPVTRLK
jgi:flagellar hook assembly protein FlgD